jgi:hypothetical protein
VTLARFFAGEISNDGGFTWNWCALERVPDTSVRGFGVRLVSKYKTRAEARRRVQELKRK